MAATVTLADARLIRELRSGRAGAFITVWNAHVAQVWATLRAVLEPAEALAWAHGFRAELPGRVGAFTLEEPLAEQILDALRAHVAAGDATLAERLADVGEVARAVPPEELLLRAPGGEPQPGWARRWGGAVLVGALLVAVAVAVAWRPPPLRWADAAARHAAAQSEEVLLGSDPEALSTALSRAGVRPTLTEAPELAPEGLALVGAVADHVGTSGETVVLVYTQGATPWTLQHTHAPLPDDASGAEGAPVDHVVGALHLAGWADAGGSWVLCGPTDAASPATRIRDRRSGT